MDPINIEYPVRLNRYIALCGVAARRKADLLITEGRVTVDGVTETSLGRVLTAPALVCVDEEPIAPARPVYMVMNKPRGILSAVNDARGRTVLDILPDFYRQLGLFPVGRLDKESEGLIILTNDGVFAQNLIHPSSCIKRTYLVYLRYNLDKNRMKEWERGVIIGERFAKPLEIHPAEDDQSGKRFIVVLGEGFKREIRLMVQALDNRVVRLQRTAIGGLVLKKLPLGAYNELSLTDMQEMIASGGEV